MALGDVNPNNDVAIDSMVTFGAKTVQVAAAGTDPNSASFPKVKDLVVVGYKAGLINDIPRKGEDGAYYSQVDTHAQIRLGGITGTFTDGQPVYVSSGGAISGTAAGNTFIGFADRAKANSAAGNLWVQLAPRGA